MTRYYVFNGDADGLCALQQLRLADPGASGLLVTGVKRDIALLGRVIGSSGDECVVLDVSLDVNRAPLMELLQRGVSIRYFDHHFAGEVPPSDKLEPHLDPSPTVCTSILVDRYLDGRHRDWACVGAFGDSLTAEGAALAGELGLSDEQARRLKDLGITLNYNAYGETLDDLHMPPALLAEEMLPYASALAFAESSETYRRLRAGYEEDMERARRLEPRRNVPGAIQFLLPDAAWARRSSGTLANDLAKQHAGNALAIVSPKTSGGFLVSIRVPADAKVAADEFCRRFPTGGGRRTAAGINLLPEPELDRFSSEFEAAFATT
jgi:hypothetical protein